jgi:glucose/mannose-6-phosphate isomerase
MHDHILSFPEQVRRGRERVQEISLPCASGAIDHVVLVGMGGSAIAGDLLAALVEPESAVPVSVVRSYGLPRYVDERTLVIVSSYSGNTEETLAGFDAAVARDSYLYCITSNGRVRDRALREDIPFHVLPEGMPPRAALGFSLAAVVQVAEALDLIDVPEEAWQEVTEVLAGMARELDCRTGNNRAIELAKALAERLPIIYSGAGLLAPVNLRWRCQFEENAERLAFGNLYPEWNHNEIMGWARPQDQWLLDRLGVITLRDRDDHPQVQQRMNIIRDLLEDKAGFWTEVTTRGDHRLTRMLSLIHLGDWTSLYLSVLTGANPMSISLIRELKTRLVS